MTEMDPALTPPEQDESLPEDVKTDTPAAKDEPPTEDAIVKGLTEDADADRATVAEWEDAAPDMEDET